MTGERKDFGNVLYDRIRKLAGESRNSGAIRGEDRPQRPAAEAPSPRLIKPARTAAQHAAEEYDEAPPEPEAKAAEPGEEAQASTPPPTADRSIGSVLARLDAREAALSEPEGAGGTVSNRPLDAIVEDMLRPMLSDWLDRNLERIVREQVDEALQAEFAAQERQRSSDSE